MTTYNLDSATFNSGLLAFVSQQTANIVEGSLSAAGLPQPGTLRDPSPGSAPGPTTISSGSFFIYTGANGTTSDVTSGGGNILATGYPGGSVNDTSATGNDTLVGGAVAGTVLTVNLGNNTLIAGSGAETLYG